MLNAGMSPVKSLSCIEERAKSTILSEISESADMKDLIKLVGIDKVGVIAMDNTSSVSLILFDHHVTQILGKNVVDLRDSVQQQGGDEFTFPDELNDLKRVRCLFKFQVTDYNIDTNYHHYTVNKLSTDPDEIANYISMKNSGDGGIYNDSSCDTQSSKSCNVHKESCSSISDLTDNTPDEGKIKRRSLFAHDDIVEVDGVLGISATNNKLKMILSSKKRKNDHLGYNNYLFII